MLFIILAGILALLFYFKFTKINNYWAEKGVPYIKPRPLIGNLAPNIFQTRAFPLMLEDIYKLYPESRYMGMYQFQRPTLLIRDLELIKTIAVKEIDTFPNHQLFGAFAADPLASKNLLNLTVADGWHDMRATLSPTFTSSKMRSMLALMEQCANQFVDYFDNQGDIVTVELKDVFTKLTNNIFGITQFGVSYNSFKDRNNQLYLMGQDITNVKILKVFGFTIIPKLLNLLNVSFFTRETEKSFKQMIVETIRIREEQEIVRPDMIHLLMEARKGRINNGSSVKETAKRQKAELTDDDLTAQALIFFFGGHDTTATTMSYLTIELASNPDVQEKLREEIETTFQNSDESINYDTILNMKYLDCCVSETLRKWPPFAFTDRISVKPFTIEAEQPGEKPLFLEADSQIWFPIFPIQRDPNYYPDPDRFDPERFSDENKHNIKPFSHIPFGAGPRICIGLRFALLEVKLVVIKLLQKFEIVPVKRTTIPLVLSKTTFFPLPEGGFWVGLKPRSASR